MSSQAPETLWFRLAVRGIGILLLAWGIPSLVSSIFLIGWQATSFFAGGINSDWWWYAASAILGPVAQIAVGVYLVFGARGLIAYCTRGALGMCPACNYDIRNVPGASCPECGVPLPGRATPPTMPPPQP